MNLSIAEKLAQTLLKENDLVGWSLGFDRAKKRFGYCNFRERHISLSRTLTELNSTAVVRDTILHEIAHALVGPRHGHDAVWRERAKALGARASRSCGADVITPRGKYVATCRNCNLTFHAHRRSRGACKKCCEQFNAGRYTARFAFVFETPGN